MNWIIPIGGKGTRTQTLGEFKPFIKIKGLKMLWWFFSSVKKNILPQDNFYFITTKYYLDKFNVDEEIGIIFKNLDIKNFYKVVCPTRETS